MSPGIGVPDDDDDDDRTELAPTSSGSASVDRSELSDTLLLTIWKLSRYVDGVGVGSLTSGDGVGVSVGWTVGAPVGVAVDVEVIVAVGVFVGVSVGVDVGV